MKRNKVAGQISGGRPRKTCDRIALAHLLGARRVKRKNDAGQKVFGYMADWYVFGIYVLAAYNGKKLMDQGREPNIEVDKKDKDYPASARDIIRKLTEKDPLKRLGVNGFEEIRDHPFFKDIDWEKL